MVGCYSKQYNMLYTYILPFVQPSVASTGCCSSHFSPGSFPFTTSWADPRAPSCCCLELTGSGCVSNVDDVVDSFAANYSKDWCIHVCINKYSSHMSCMHTTHIYIDIRTAENFQILLFLWIFPSTYLEN